MDKFDRIYELHRILSAHKTVLSSEQLSQRLECTPATVKRIIRVMRDSLNAPIEYSREFNGYFYDHATGPIFELPGLWFNEQSYNRDSHHSKDNTYNRDSHHSKDKNKPSFR